MVPAGSREALSERSTFPSTGFGEGTLGDVADSEAIRLPDLAVVFSRRAERLSALAPGHELEAFLRLMAALATAQQASLSGLPPGTLPASSEVAAMRRSGRSPLDPVSAGRDATWRAALDRIIETIDRSVLPEPARATVASLAQTPPAVLEAMADRFLSGEVERKDAAAVTFVAAALQVAWTRMAALLDKADLASDAPETGTCPVCASPSVAGIVSPGGTKFGHRHLHCSLCATAWRYVRVRCIHCGSTDKVSFRQFAGASFVRAECCEKCHGYSKVFYLDHAKPVEPFADDLASLGLDMLVGEEGFSRAPNPFVIGMMERSQE
ncbi:FdhE protein [Enhydrobacter aerosaccus]|uniref:FdhE protein n=1 Tax=Enhydrobacter aerosaccus TaxID=225324 RepID=A0A1T4PMX4_9HYPH|nr:formate dehydrogenase accessory protein FdhE [Enhydrobacter aerosaccus]SJZ92900.1 FdhE protein [Enhydrobacter aerosaccus]